MRRFSTDIRANISRVASSASSGVLLTANSGRACVSVTNDDANALYLLCEASAASTTNYTVIIASDGYWESPIGYAGEVRGIWALDGSGAAQITEYIY